MHDHKITALYPRISKDDENQGDSNSIASQKQMLLRYAEEHGFPNPTFFVDDGFTGTNFQRPGFQEMMAAVEAGKVSTIIVKDMSRFGRNYLHVGLYTEEILPRAGVRFIAISDGVDSSQTSLDNDILPFRNIMNEMYAKDTSKKIRAQKRSAALAGERLGGWPPFGYLTDPKDRKKWIIDRPCADIVREIFDLFLSGNSLLNISKILNNRGVITPCQRKEEMGNNCGASTANKVLRRVWTAVAITQILERRSYIGDTVSSMTTTTSYKDKRRIQVPKDSWVITENTHEPIIKRETWFAVQQMRNKGKKRPNKDGKTLPLHGLIFCADCGSKAYYTNRKSYNCGRYKNSSRHSGIEPCFSHHIMYRTLEKYVLSDLQELVAFVKKHEADFIKKIESYTSEHMAKTAKEIAAEHEKSTARITEIDRTINFLYADRTSGILPAERFAKMLVELEAEQKALVEEISALKATIDSQAEVGNKAKQFITLVRKTSEITELTHEIAGAFIHKIYLGKPEHINGERHQEIEIEYNAIGKIEI